MTRVLNFISSKCSQPGCRNERIFIYVAASKRKQVRGEGGKKRVASGMAGPSPRAWNEGRGQSEGREESLMDERNEILFIRG